MATQISEFRPKAELPNWESDNTVDTFLEICESLLENAGVPEDHWVGYVVPKLPPQGRTVFENINKHLRNSYSELKKELLIEVLCHLPGDISPKLL